MTQVEAFVAVQVLLAAPVLLPPPGGKKEYPVPSDHIPTAGWICPDAAARVKIEVEPFRLQPLGLMPNVVEVLIFWTANWNWLEMGGQARVMAILDPLNRRKSPLSPAARVWLVVKSTTLPPGRLGPVAPVGPVG